MTLRSKSMLIGAATVLCVANVQAGDNEYGSGDVDAQYGMTHTQDGEAMADAQEQVKEAHSVVRQMKSDPELAQRLEQARGVFIIPDYAKVAAVVGGQGGEGVVLLRDRAGGGEWTAPAFFDFGGGSLGADIGVKAGSIAMLLMSDEAANMFREQDDNWSLDANAGLTIINWSAEAEGSAGKEDVIVWTDTEGAFAGVDLGVNDISADDDETAAFYGEHADVQDVLDGKVVSNRANDLRAALGS